jgi:hypothetical protein
MLKKFEGRAVVGAAVKITRAGDGLSEAMRLEPEALAYGQEVWFVVKGVVDQIAYKTIPKTDALQRIHVVKAEEIAKVDGEEVEKYILAEKDRLARLLEEENGVSRLPLDSDPPGVFDQQAAEAEAAQSE